MEVVSKGGGIPFIEVEETYNGSCQPLPVEETKETREILRFPTVLVDPGSTFD